MAIQVRVRDKDSLAQFLGWFSLGLGTAQAVAPRVVCRLVGADADGRAPAVMRALGVRELAQGTGILVRPRPKTWLWSRVAGDVLDLSLLAATAVKNRRLRTAFAIANVVAVTVPDVYESRFMSRRGRRGLRAAKLIRKAVTIDRAARGGRARVGGAGGGARRSRATARRSASPRRRAAAAPSSSVEFEFDPPAGDLGAAAQKLLGSDLATQLSDDLRRLKQRVETGQVVRSEGAPDGHLLAEHLKQRAAQPLEEAVR